MAGADIRFPNLGLELDSVGTGITVFGFEITFYGIIIALGMVMGFLIVEWQAKRTGQDKDLYLDFALYAIVLSVIGARLYYVIFSWSEYKDNLIQIFNIRGGGLAIYGGVLAAILTAFVYTKIKKISFLLLLDTACAGLVTGQIIGRWGNFFNREAFGGYTDNLFAMQLKKTQVQAGNITSDILNHVVNVDQIEYIQVHPTFLYESLWNIGLLIILLLYTKRKKYDGEIVLLYLLGYGLGRMWIESLRTDQLLIWGTGLAVSQMLSFLLVIFAITMMIWKNVMLQKNKKR